MIIESSGHTTLSIFVCFCFPEQFFFESLYLSYFYFKFLFSLAAMFKVIIEQVCYLKTLCCIRMDVDEISHNTIGKKNNQK